MLENAVYGWTVGYSIATFIIAAVAVVSLWLNFRTSRKTAEVLQNVKEAFTAYVAPLIVFTSFQWINDKNGVPLSPGNLPKGIRAELTNVSNIPLQIHSNELTVFFGERKLSDSLTSTKPTGATIIEAGAKTGSAIISKDDFQSLLPKMSNGLDKPPFLTLRIEVVFSRLNDESLNEYAAEIFIAANIDDFKSQMWVKNAEKLTSRR